MAKKKAARTKYDWEAIESLYRAGHISIREIGKQHGCSDTAIRKKAKANGWKRDLIDKVNREVRNKLVRTSVRNANLSEAKIIEAAANTVAGVIRCHQKKISTGLNIVDKLLDQLLDAATSRSEIEGDITEDTKGDKKSHKRNRMLKAVSLKEHSVIVVNLSNAMRSFVTMERQAYNITEGDGDKTDDISKIMADLDIGGLPVK